MSLPRHSRTNEYEPAISRERAMVIADHYATGPDGKVRSGEGSRALLHFAKTGRIGKGLRSYLTDSRANPTMMPPKLASLANYVRTH